jgi:hypothetical protein
MVIYSKTFDQHLNHVNQVLSWFYDAGLTVKPSTVMFAVPEISFLCHCVSPLGIAIDPIHTHAICDFPLPKNVKGLLALWENLTFITWPSRIWP